MSSGRNRLEMEMTGYECKNLLFFKSSDMAKKFPLHPKHPERTCWGCDKYRSVNSLQCGNGSGRTQHLPKCLEKIGTNGETGNQPSAESPQPAIDALKVVNPETIGY